MDYWYLIGGLVNNYGFKHCWLLWKTQPKPNHKRHRCYKIIPKLPGERPYSCNECQHHFTNWPNYNKHMKRRHGINTSVTCRTKQDIPPTGMPHRNPPGTVLAPPQATVVPETFVDQPPTFFPVLNLYSLPEELLPQRIWICESRRLTEVCTFF